MLPSSPRLAGHRRRRIHLGLHDLPHLSPRARWGGWEVRGGEGMRHVPACHRLLRRTTSKEQLPKRSHFCPWLTTNRRIHRFVNRMPHISRGGRPFPYTEMVMVYDVRVQVILICTGDACEDEGSRQLLKCARATIPGKTYAILQMPVICSLGSAMFASVSSPFSTPHIKTTTAFVSHARKIPSLQA